ncbi:AAA family ATPase [Mycobacterium sp. 21AC1]|uniref:AAA family ATPase n=1 Tax=[Mycobacterium] appelbergii TaxID=2939269 RepID=UPI0029392C18|nr:AAA family ATPase [Mycobacterium sp. 21AC1]MDV3130383.1 AAA family ATPase [Mycobacterium sp. 21AC1]
MANKHRKSRQRAKRIATIGAATATVTALTVGVAPPPQANAAAVDRNVDLRGDFRPFPPPEQIPDLSFGLGSAGYDLSQAIGAQILTQLVENINLAALAQAAGLDLESLTAGLLNQVLGGAVGGVLGEVPVDLRPILAALPLGEFLGQVLDVLGTNTTIPLGDLLGILGLDLSAPLDLSNVGDDFGLNIITAGAPFTLLKLFGVDLGWVPPFPNSVADEINGTPYLSVGVGGVANLIDAILPDLGLPFVKEHLIAHILEEIATGPLAGLDLVDLRVPIAVGVGLGAFATGAAYQQVVDDLPNQPGGADYTGTNPILGSFTILPMLLLDNPGRANGGILARAYPFFRLFGIDTVTPDTQVQSSSNGQGLLDVSLLGLTIGGANLIPIKIDATAEYLPMSDFAAWPNPFTMANNVAAGMFPTYILRNQTVTGIVTNLAGEVVGQLGDDLADYIANQGDDPTKGPKLNIFYTLDAQSLPLLEPTYLAIDLINLFTGANLNNPLGTALTPALTTLVNLGYTDVEREEVDGVVTYVRTFDDSDIPTAFGSFPEVDWTKVPADVAKQLAQGVQQAISDGLVDKDGQVSNVLATVLGLLGIGGNLPGAGSGLDLTGITEALENATGGILNNSPGSQALRATDFEPQEITNTGATKNDTKVLSLEAAPPTTPEPEDEETPTGKPDAKTLNSVGEHLKSNVDDARDKAKASAEKARARTDKAFKNAQERLNKVAENGRKQIRAAAEGVEKAVNDAAENVKKATTPPKKKAKAEKKDDAKKDDTKKDAA